MEPLKIVVNGAKGKMGTALIACAAKHPDIKIVGQLDVGDDIKSVISVIREADVAVDFSSPAATLPLLVFCERHQKALVIGTTGHSGEECDQIGFYANRFPIVKSSNFAVGVNALFWLTRKAAEILGTGFDLEIVEMHHRLKKDAPSGTAHTLAKILAEARGRQLDEVIKHGRAGIVGARTSEEIGVHSLRGGDVFGEHTVIFAGDGQRVELVHKASSRACFAEGALLAARWVVGKPSGLYDTQDVLGLKD